MKNALKQRTLRLEQLENRELLSATSWNDAAQADAALAAEMAATLNEASIDVASAISAAELETTATESTIWRVTTLEDGAEGSLRWAVANAQDGDSICFDPALSQEWDDGNYVKIVLTEGEIVVDKDITIDGYDLYHFEDLEGLIHDQDHTGVRIDAQDASRIFNIASGADVKIVGVHMTNGSVRFDPETGEAWELGQELPKHTDASIDAAHDADHHGGALHIPLGAKLSLSMCVVSNSKAIQGGGAVAVSGEFFAADTIFENNHGGVDHGGAIRIFDGFVEVTDCYFRDNTILPYGYLNTSGSGSGGGNWGGSWGGGWWPGGGGSSSGSWVDKSSTTGGGGAVAASGGAFRSFNSSYTGNCGWYGGAIHVNGGKVLISNNLIVNNGGKAYKADGDYKWNLGCYNGGGVDCDGGTLTIVNSTIADNIAVNSGSGVYINGNSGNPPKVNVYNSIVANNKTEGEDWTAKANNFDVVSSGTNAYVYGYHTLTDYTGWTRDANGQRGVGIINLAQSDDLFLGDDGEGFYRYNLGPNSPAANVGNDEYASIFHYDEKTKDWVRTEEKIKCDFVRNQRQGGGAVDLGAFERDADPYYDPIMPPENLVFSEYDANEGTIVLTWDDKSYNELGFRVEISTNGQDWHWVAQVAENVETTTLTGIEPNKTYYVRVRAEIELSNVSEWSKVAEFTAVVTTLDEPEVSAEATSATEIAFYIGEVDAAVGYVYEYSANPDFTDAIRGELTTSGMLTIANLSPNTTYYFRAYAIGAGSYLDSPWASTYAQTDKAVLPAPTPGVALTEDETTLQLSFAPVDKATEYVYRYSTSPDFENAIEATTKEAGSFEIADLEPGETYYFQAKAIGGGDYVDSDWSATISATTDVVDLPAPSLDGDAVGATTVEIVVGDVPGATEYYYRYATSEDELENATPIAVEPGTTEIAGLDPNTTYYVQVYAAGDGEGYVDSAWSTPVAATTDKIALETPSLDATATSHSTIKIDVGFVENADRYLYEYSTSPYFTSDTTTAAYAKEAGEIEVSGLNPHTTYYFRVKAVGTGAYETSGWSKDVSATTLKVALQTPEIETVALGSSEIELTIGAVEFATGYYCEYSTDSTFRSTNTLMATPGTFVLSGLDPNATYYFRVLAYGGPTAEISDWATDEAKTEAIVLNPPTPSLAKSGNSSSQLKLSFTAVDNAKSYVYRYSTSPDFTNATTVDATAAGDFTVRNLSSGRTYYFQVMAKGDGDTYLDSAWSGVVSATTSAINLPAPSVVVQEVGSTSLTFEVGSVAGASGYYYRVSTNPDFTGAKDVQLSAAGTVVLTGLNPATTYYVQAYADGDGRSYIDSDWSNAVEATTVKIALDAPDVAARAVDSSTLTFEIGEVANADGYVYEISTSRYFTDDAIVSTGTAASAGAFDVDGLNPYTTYYFRAKAVVDAGSEKSETHESSAWSEVEPATTDKAALPAPEIGAVATNPTTIALTIKPVANAAGYVYLVATDENFEDYREVESGSGTMFLTGLTPGATYYFKAMSKASANGVYDNSDWSDATSAEMQFVLDAPTVDVVATGATTVDLTISPVDNATEYVYRYATSEEALADAEWSDPVPAGTIEISGLDPYATYYVQAYAVGDGAGYVDSEWSETDSATTERGQLPVPTIEVVSLSDDAFEFNFEKDENATSYVYQVSTSPVADPNAWETATDSTIALDGLTPNTVYYIFVQGIGNEAYADSPVADSVARTWEEASTIVTIADDVLDHYDGEISLREALLYAEDGATITFDKSLREQTVTLNEPAVVDKTATIDATRYYNYGLNDGMVDDLQDATRITIAGDGASGLFQVVEGADLTAIGVHFADGGDAFDVQGTLTLYDGSVTNCDLAVSVYGEEATFNATRVIFEGNVGALSVADGANASVVDVVFQGNVGEAAVVVQDATYESLRSIYSDNEGAACDFENASVYLATEIFVDNGGNAIELRGGDLTIVNSTLAANGGGICVSVAGDGAAARLTAYNTIVVENETGDIIGAGDAASLIGKNNLTTLANDAWTEGADNVVYNGDADALFEDLSARDLRIKAESQAYDAGDDSLALDAQGNPLVKDWAGNNLLGVGESVDIGALERDATLYFGLAAPEAIIFGEFDMSTKKLPMTWDAVEGATRYRVEAANVPNPTDADFFFSTNIADVTRIATLSYVDRAYTFRVRAEIATGAEPDLFSDWTYATFKPGVPTQPGPIVFGDYDPTNGRLEMAWGDSTGETYYRVEYSRDGGETWHNSGSFAADTTERIATLGYRYSEYKFRVCAVNEAGASAWTYGTFRAGAPTQPGAIEFGAYDQETGRLEMSWGASTGEMYYRVEYSRDGGATWSNSGSVDANVTDRVATLGYRYDEYQFRICAVNGVGASEWTYGTFTPPAMDAATGPTSVVFDSYDPETGELTMSWTGVLNADLIRVEFTYNGGKTWSHSQTLSGDATGRIAKISGVNRTYQFRVCAINADNKNDADSWVWTYSDTFKASEWNADPTAVAISAAFADLFVDDSEDDFWGAIDF